MNRNRSKEWQAAISITNEAEAHRKRMRCEEVERLEQEILEAPEHIQVWAANKIIEMRKKHEPARENSL